MFINIAYKDAPELSSLGQRSVTEQDMAVEKLLLVNPDCPVRIMLEYIRKKCRLGTFTQFDLCDESGGLKGLFNLATFAYATQQFEHKKTYYLIVLRYESDKRLSILPQLNHDNKLHAELKFKVRRFVTTGDTSPQPTPPLLTPPPKGTPPSAKPAAKKK